MDFALERFAEAVDPAFHCQLCGQVLEEPACTPCGHVFCASCLLPWAARRRRCPLQCQPLAPGELYRVLPLRSLVQQLRVRCDYRARGCGHTVRLRELAAHVQSCDFGLASGCGRHCSGSCCGGGRKERNQATTTQPSGDTREGPPRSGGRPRVAPYRWLGKTLRTQLSFLQRRCQKKLARYMAHTRNFVGDPGGRGRGGEQKSFTVVLEREDDTLGFNIIGGRPNQNYQKQSATEGIYVSKIVENGPADRVDGLEIHDKIIEVRQRRKCACSVIKTL
ncbi:PDZ domain-containing RING finger protein 4-like [Phodopus roborovskii]|uniref:PDZ domain-containing RING finger protein 4-like n=1 Tax=Phodopus roborovskii TaxID=109678 RepID=UPI0021E45DF0|nr:PDZ domain-containing RING finger protein 4-like [Phodopus roborovskii]